MKSFVTSIAVLTFIVVFLSKANAADLAPYHVISSNKLSVTVDLDKNLVAPELITVFGQHGWSTATLRKKAEKCEFLCGEGNAEGRECHNEGIYIINKKELQGSLSGPLMAIAGKANIKNTKDQIKFKKANHKVMPDKYVSKEFSQGYRWAKDEKSGKTFLFSKYMGPTGVGSKDWYAPPISLDSCKLKASGDFEILECGGVTMLYHQKEFLELSMAEYSSGELNLKFSVNIKGKAYYAIEVSVKGHGQRLKLFTKNGKKWVGFFRPPTYAAMC